MKRQSWLQAQIKEIETLAEEMGNYGVVLGLQHALIVCAEEAGAAEEPHTPQSHLLSYSKKDQFAE